MREGDEDIRVYAWPRNSGNSRGAQRFRYARGNSLHEVLMPRYETAPPLLRLPAMLSAICKRLRAALFRGLPRIRTSALRDLQYAESTTGSGHVAVPASRADGEPSLTARLLCSMPSGRRAGRHRVGRRAVCQPRLCDAAGDVVYGNPPRKERSPKVEFSRTLNRGGSHENITVY